MKRFKMFLRLLEEGHIYKNSRTSILRNVYTVLPDRYVEGVCPHCHEEARGDHAMRVQLF